MKPVDEFISVQADDVRERLEAIRSSIKQAVPDATETISYGIPTFQINGKNMVHYGPGKRHIGVYATPDGHSEFEAELGTYKRGKGSVQFPLSEPLPISLITRMAEFRAEQLRKGER